MTVECYEPVAEDCFVSLLREIGQVWNESREAIDEYLGRLNGQEPVNPRLPQLTVILEGTPDGAKDWLMAQTPYECSIDELFPTVEGYILLIRFRAKRLGDTGWQVHMEAQHNRPAVKTVGNVFRIIEFQLLEVGRGTEMAARCWQPEVLSYYCGLLGRIAEAWPASRAQIDACLKGLGVEGPAAETEQAPSGGDDEREPLGFKVPKPMARQRSHRLPDHERRKAIWYAIAPVWNQFHSYAKCRRLLLDKHANLLKPGKSGPTIDNKTLRSIIEEGQAGLLK